LKKESMKRKRGRIKEESKDRIKKENGRKRTKGR
jgi:hypothetical protein